MDKTAAITNYATSVGIRVTLPKWGLSRGEYFFDIEKRIIAKGLTSIKYMSANLADEMADVLWVLVCLANQTGVDLTEAFQKNMEKKTKRDKMRHQQNEKLR